MNKEQKRLLNMLEEHKISEEDYLLLSNALKKKSVFGDIENSLLLNPFQKIAGFKALFLGLVLTVIMSMAGVYVDIYYDGVIGFFMPYALKTKVQPNFFLLFYQNFIACCILSGLFLIAALIYRQKKIRPIDFLGTVAFARYPLLLSVIIYLIEKLIRPKEFEVDYSKGIELHFSLFNTISGLLFYVCLIWQIMTYFFALKEASGLEGRRLWISFITALLLAEVIAEQLTRIFIFT